MLFSFIEPVEMTSWLWRGYAIGLNTTIFLGGVCVLAAWARGAGPELRSRIWVAALLGTVVVIAACAPWYSSGREAVPIGWSFSALSGVLAAPMIELASAGTAARYARAAAAPEALSGQPVLLLAALLCALWVVGAGLVLIRLVRGWVAASLLTRGAAPMRDPEWDELLSRARRRLGVRRTVRLRRLASGGAPLTWGILRPTVLLPAGCDGWPPAHREAVLLHEVEHVRRNDCLVQIAGQLVCAALWFHPLLWLVLRRIHEVREEACDDAVLRAGLSRSDYAECLLHIGDMARLEGNTGAVAVSAAMVRTPRLKKRLHRILRHEVPGTSRAAGPVAACAVLMLLVLAGSVRLNPAATVVRASLADENWASRALAALYLAHRPTPEDASILEAALSRDPDPRVRRAVELLAGRRH